MVVVALDDLEPKVMRELRRERRFSATRNPHDDQGLDRLRNSGT
jgi:hypothetical protein